MFPEASSTSLTTAELVRQSGDVFRLFDRRTQDSGNVSYGMVCGSARFFVKTAGVVDDPRPHLEHEKRVALLRNAVRLSREIRHPLLAGLHRVIECTDGPLLIYRWAEGELLRSMSAERDSPDSPLARFRQLRVQVITRVLGEILDLHERLVTRGWIASDWYDGCLLFDFQAERLTVIDLDHYHCTHPADADSKPAQSTCAGFINEMGRLFGSSRFMAPEEFQRGACIDERTTVFNLGRTIEVLCPHAPVAIRAVAEKACAASPAARYHGVTELSAAFKSALPTVV